MLNNTRFAIRPFKNHDDKDVTPAIIAQLMAIWAPLASALEEEMKLSEKEILVWCLMVVGGKAINPEAITTKTEQPHAIAMVELCLEGGLPKGAYCIQSSTSSYQGTMISLAAAEVCIFTDSLGYKGTDSVWEQVVAVSYLAHNLRKDKK